MSPAAFLLLEAPASQTAQNGDNLSRVSASAASSARPSPRADAATAEAPAAAGALTTQETAAATRPSAARINITCGVFSAVRLHFTSGTAILLLVTSFTVLAADYDYPPTRYTAQDQVPSDEGKVFTDAEDTTHYWGANNHKLALRFVPEPRGYVGTSFRLRGIISSGFKLRKVSLELPRTDAYYWPGDSDIMSGEAFYRRRRLQAAIPVEVHSANLESKISALLSKNSSTTPAAPSLPLSGSEAAVLVPQASHLASSASTTFSSINSSPTPATVPKFTDLSAFTATSSSLPFTPSSGRAPSAAPSPSSGGFSRLSASSVSLPSSPRQFDQGPASYAFVGSPRLPTTSTAAFTSKHPLWSAFPNSSPPKVIRHAPGTHPSHAAKHPPLHPRQHMRRLTACEPLPPETEDIVKKIFEKHGVSTDGVFIDENASSKAAAHKKAGQVVFSSALEALKEDPDAQAFDAVVHIPEILPPFHPKCPANTACGAEYCSVYGCEEERKGKGLASTTAAVDKLLWIPPKEIQLVVHVDVPASATSMQEQWYEENGLCRSQDAVAKRLENAVLYLAHPGCVHLCDISNAFFKRMLQILEKPPEAGQLKTYPGYEDVFQMGYNIGDVVKKKTNELFYKYLPPLRNPLRVEQIRLDGGKGLGSFNFTFSAVVTPERQRIYAELEPQLHLTLPGPACSTSETTWVRPFDSKPIWLASNQLRECWDLFQACETLQNGGLFETCDLAYEKLRDDAPVARKIVLGGASRDIPARPFTLKFSGLYPPSTNLTHTAPHWYMQIASGYPKTLKQKEERAKLDETYSQIIKDLYAAGDCIGWTFRPFVDKRLRDQKPKISHQSYFYTPQLALLPTIVRGAPSDTFPFFLNLTFSVNTLARDSTIEFALPHLLLPREGLTGAAAAAQRYDPFTREFLSAPPPELLEKWDENGRLKLQFTGFNLKRQVPVSIYLPVPPLPRYGHISSVWADPNGLSLSTLTKQGFSLVVKDKKGKELLSTFRFPTPVFSRREIGGVVGPEFQVWNAKQGEVMAMFKIFLDRELDKSSVRFVLEVLGNYPNDVEGSVLNRKDPNMCTAILRAPTELLVRVSCPQPAKEIFHIDVSTLNGERKFPVGWYVLGVLPQASATEIAWFTLHVLNAHRKIVYHTSLLADKSRRSVQQQPCVNRLITDTTRHTHTGYTSKVKFTFQLYNCFYPAQPMKPMPQQQEPLEARVPKGEGWPKREYFSSVDVYRRTQFRQVPTSQSPLRKAIQRYFSRTRRMCGVNLQTKKCTAAQLEFETIEELDPPHHLNPMKESELLVASPSLAAASVFFGFSSEEQAGLPRPPPGRQYAPAHKNPMSLHVRRRERLAIQEEEAKGDGADGAEVKGAEAMTERIVITVHILLDEVHLDEEAVNAFKRFVALKVEDNSRQTLCLEETGVLCYFYSYKSDKNVVAWRGSAALETPRVESSTRPAAGQVRVVVDQLSTLLQYAKEQRSVGQKLGLMNWTIVLTHRDLADAYEKEVLKKSSSTETHDVTAFPEHVLLLGWTSEVPEHKKTLQQQLEKTPFSPIRHLLLGNKRDTNFQQITKDPILISFVYAEPTEYLGGHVPLLRYFEEALYLIQEEYIESFVVLDVCRHPLPPDGYTYGDSVETRITEEELERPVELLYNGIPFTTLKWKIPSSDVGVYTAAKLSWQFDMACDGVVAQQSA